MKLRISVCAAILVVLILSGQAFGQYRTYGSPTGFGNILFPGTGSPPPLIPGGNSAILHPGTGNIYGQGRIYPSNHGRGNTVVVPYAVPVYVGGYGNGFGYGYPQDAPPVTVVQQQPPYQMAPAPPVVINQYYSQPPTAGAPPDNGSTSTLRLYEAPAAMPQDAPRPIEPKMIIVGDNDKPNIYLIAFKAGAIYPTLAYWVEGDTLQYISMDKTLNKASMDLIDRDLSTRLNKERNVEFSLPSAPPK
jgi:hypothetical protein